MSHKKGKIKTLGLIAAGIFVAALLYLVFVPRAVEVEVARVTVGPFQETIRADGILRSKERYTVTAFADGDIKRVSLRVGDVLNKGEKITELFWDVRYVPVSAPIAGVISKVYRESAGPIRRGEAIVEMVDPLQLEIIVELLTTDAVRLRIGAQAWIENWSGGEPIQAKVTKVSKAGFVKQSALGVEEERTEVTAELLNPSAKALENAGNTFHVDVTFKVSESANAVKIPVGSLFLDGKGWSVYLAEDGIARKKKVEVDVVGTHEASIKSGLLEGQTVLVYPGDLVTDGSHIRIRTK